MTYDEMPQQQDAQDERVPDTDRQLSGASRPMTALPIRDSFAAALAEDLGPADLRQVLGVFAHDITRLTALLAQASAAADAVAFRRAAHGLAGAAGAVGAVGLEAASRRAMVDSARDLARDLADIVAAGTLVSAEVTRVLAWLDAELAR